ncbi:MAG: DUF1207 domain-containing protein [Planctomycetales bacterium]
MRFFFTALLFTMMVLLPSLAGHSMAAGMSGPVVGGPLGAEPIDLDAWVQQQQGGYGIGGFDPGSQFGVGPCADCPGTPNVLGPWDWQVLPENLIYRSYLAGVNEPRLAVTGFNEKDDGWLWDSSLGARVGLLRYGSPEGAYPQGIQLDAEGVALLRQDDNGDLVSTDYRVGLPITLGFLRYQTKFGYYHMSSHVGDEFLIANPGFVRINYLRDALVWGHSYQWDTALRLYFEVAYAFRTDGGSRPWEFQFGAEYSPICKTGFRGTPFVAANAHLRQELNYSGNFVFQAGWQWRGRNYGPLLRTGLHYYNGMSPQFEFFRNFEHQIGGGVWYDF